MICFCISPYNVRLPTQESSTKLGHNQQPSASSPHEVGLATPVGVTGLRSVLLKRQRPRRHSSLIVLVCLLGVFSKGENGPVSYFHFRAGAIHP